jgi:hypothetical protein
MPRGRCHWALLVRTREALRGTLPVAYEVARQQRADYFAGGVAPDALRLFAGADKLSSHFYDDQRPETWAQIVQTILAAYPSVADAGRLSEPAQAWMLGYLTHLLTDVAYWRHVVTKLPPFPEHMAVHYGAWILADRAGAEVPRVERTLDRERIHFQDAPPWIEEAAVRNLLDRLTDRLLPPDDAWEAELAYHRNRPDTRGKSDEELLAKQLPLWEESLMLAGAALPERTWAAFQEDAVRGAVEAIREYLGVIGSRAMLGASIPEKQGNTAAR